jgi:hypothetical protein
VADVRRALPRPVSASSELRPATRKSAYQLRDCGRIHPKRLTFAALFRSQCQPAERAKSTSHKRGGNGSAEPQADAEWAHMHHSARRVVTKSAHSRQTNRRTNEANETSNRTGSQGVWTPR